MGEQRQQSIKTVLVVDDDEGLLRAYERAILVAKAKPFTASNVASATKLARETAPDLAIVDLQLGRDSGIDLVAKLKAMSSPPAVVMISGYGSIETTVSAMRAGADDVIEKPVAFAEIVRRLETKGQRAADFEPATLERAQWEHVQRVLADCGGNVSMTARKLGVYRTTLRRWLRKHAPKS